MPWSMDRGTRENNRFKIHKQHHSPARKMTSQEAACQGKIGHTPQGAADIVKRMRKQKKVVMAYRCVYCGKMHIGGA